MPCSSTRLRSWVGVEACATSSSGLIRPIAPQGCTAGAPALDLLGPPRRFAAGESVAISRRRVKATGNALALKFLSGPGIAGLDLGRDTMAFCCWIALRREWSHADGSRVRYLLVLAPRSLDETGRESKLHSDVVHCARRNGSALQCRASAQGDAALRSTRATRRLGRGAGRYERRHGFGPRRVGGAVPGWLRPPERLLRGSQLPRALERALRALRRRFAHVPRSHSLLSARRDGGVCRGGHPGR
jgi:hypothetical protein